MPGWKERAPEIQKYLDKGYSIRSIATILGASYKNTRNRIGELRKAGLLKPSDATQPTQIEHHKGSYEIRKDGTHMSERDIVIAEKDKGNSEKLLTAHGFDPKDWELVTAKYNNWEVYSKQDGIQRLFGHKIIVKPRSEGRSDEEWETFFERLSKRYKRQIHTPTNYSHNGKLLEVNIADLHLGKLAWSGDSGDTYNEDIARERFFYIINDTLTRLKEFTFERILFVISNDFFHYDSPAKTTTNGTPQDATMQYEQMFDMGAAMVVEAIDILCGFAPVTTMYIASNHDRMVSFHLMRYLKAWFRNDPNVYIDASPIARKVVRFGNCLIGFTHGNLEKKRIGKWLQVEYGKDWGETIFREVHAAHIHSEKAIDEDGGQIIRYVSSPTGTDRWHHNSAWVGAIQKGQSFLWDREKGLEDTLNSVVMIEGEKPKAIQVV